MKANKRTVWFLTMLSLVAVVSIYYLNNKPLLTPDGLSIFSNPDSEIGDASDTTIKAPVFAEALEFEAMRMEVRNQRSKMNDQLRSKLTSADFTATEKISVYDEMDKLIKLDANEALMEMQIKNLGYPDVFVKNEEGKVSVRVLSTEGHSLKQADEIIHYVRTNWDDAKEVSVEFTGE